MKINDSIIEVYEEAFQKILHREAEFTCNALPSNLISFHENLYKPEGCYEKAWLTSYENIYGLDVNNKIIYFLASTHKLRLEMLKDVIESDFNKIYALANSLKILEILGRAETIQKSVDDWNDSL